jgi:hypothetical protein
MMALRATILLAFLVTVPLFAIFGKNAPEVVKSFIQNFMTRSNGDSPSLSKSPDAPVFRPSLESPSNPGGQPAQANLPGTSNPHQRDFGPSGQSGANPHSSMASPAGLRTGAAEVERQPAVIPISHLEQGVGSNRPVAAASGIERSATSPADDFPRNYFRDTEQRLRALGAKYYLLEAFGQNADSYRFVCNVSAGQNSPQVRSFVAMDRDPLSAMNTVVQQVEQWRASGRQ